MANCPLGIENVFPVGACAPLPHTNKIVYSLLNAWVLSHPLLSRQLPSNSSIPLYGQTIVNNDHALLPSLPSCLVCSSQDLSLTSALSQCSLCWDPAWPPLPQGGLPLGCCRGTGREVEAATQATEAAENILCGVPAHGLCLPPAMPAVGEARQDCFVNVWFIYTTHKSTIG